MSALGKYRNKMGVELEVIGYRVDRNVIGTIYSGVIRDDLFGASHVLVTPDGLIECGYVKTDDDEGEQ